MADSALQRHDLIAAGGGGWDLNILEPGNYRGGKFLLVVLCSSPTDGFDGCKGGDYYERESVGRRVMPDYWARAPPSIHCPNSGADAVRGTRCWWASLHTTKRV